MFQIMCGEYEEVRPVTMDPQDIQRLDFASLVKEARTIVVCGHVVFEDRSEAETFVTIYNLGCSLRCDRAFVQGL